MFVHDVRFLSRYPFLKESKEYIEGKNLSIDAIAESPVYGSAIKIAIERIINGIKRKTKYSPILNLEDTGYEIYLISFPLSKIFLSQAEVSENLRQLYAKSEGMLFETFIKKENENVRTEILREILNFSRSQNRYVIYFADYLFYTKNLKDGKLDLINRRMNNGLVEVNENELITIARDILERKYAMTLNLSGVNLPEIIVEKAKLLKNEIKKIEGEISPKISVRFKTNQEMPPSIARIIQKIENKENTNHNERFVLASFLLNKEIPVEEIKKIFAHSSNYDEKKTSYYLDYLSKRKYTCPSYTTMKSLGIMISEEEEKFKNPLAYRKKEK
ncbi:MAG: hypothetical protein AUK59_00980 [Candidatus Altarchaeum sp. CG2_30_32_3053]|nr:MAG: hypothetical protein AUK59_00980 [Candidatus Altarchaeum sp. CG2_30_32_3053]